MYMSSKLRHIFILANILWVVIIFILCAMPSDDIPDPHWNIPHPDLSDRHPGGTDLRRRN